MILIINTIFNDYFELILALKPGDFKLRKVTGKFRQAEKLLPALDRFLKLQKVKPEKLRAIGVVTGPGGFTAVRIGVAVANGMGFALGIPVVGLRADEYGQHRELVEKIFAAAKTAGKSKLAMPYYDREPNITVKKVVK